VAPALLEVGRIDKPHGLRGEVIVRLVTNRQERLAAGERLATSSGAPLVVRSSSPHQGRFIVAFDGVTDRAGADALRGVVLLAPPLEDPDELWVHEMIGAQVIDEEGTVRGRVVEVEANPASDLLVLDSGALVPVQFVVEVEAGERVVIHPPAGLFDVQ
jgi:16S rRNA processing protein RimM